MLIRTSPRALSIVNRAADAAPAAQACCGVCRTCTTTNLFSLALAAAGGIVIAATGFAQRLGKRS